MVPSRFCSPFAALLLLRIGDEVGEGEAVVGGDEVHASGRLALEPEAVGRARKAGGQIGDRAVAAPEPPDIVAVLVVPLAPAAAESAELVAARPDVPGFGDQPQRLQHRILLDCREQRCARLEAGAAAAQGRGEIEPEAVDAAETRPGPQGLHHQADHGGVIGGKDVAAAGIVDVAGRVGLIEPVVAGVVEAAQRDRRALRVAFAGMVVDHVEDHLDAGGVQRRGGGADLVPTAWGEPRVGSEEADGIVVPVIAQSERLQVAFVERRRGRQQLHGRDAERLQVSDGSRRSQPGEGAAQRFGHAGVQHGEAAHMQFGDHDTVPRQRLPPWLGRRRRHHNRLRHHGGAVRLVGVSRTGFETEQRRLQREWAVDRKRMRVEEELRRVEAMALVRIVRPGDAQAVPGSESDLADMAVKHVAGALGKSDSRDLAGAGFVEEADVDRLGIGGVHGDVDAIAVERDASWFRQAGRNVVILVRFGHRVPRLA